MLKFTVLMSVYINEKPTYLKRALESIFSQSAAPDEVVLVKDGPLTAGLDNVIEEFSKTYPQTLKIISLPTNRGLGGALAAGLLKCSHEMIARMDSDDICHYTRFEKQILFMKNNQDIDVVGSFITEFEDDEQYVSSLRTLPTSPASLLKLSRKRCPMNHVTALLKKSAVLRAGNYSSAVAQEDWYLWARMIMQGSRLAIIPEPLVHVRTGKDMFKRRGGLKALYNDFMLQREFYRMKFVTLPRLFVNVSIRAVVRLVPNSVRSFIYVNFLRVSYDK